MTDLRDLAAEITTHLSEHFPDSDRQLRQVMCLAEEAGEFLAAYRRWAGKARRTSPFEDVQAELADVFITGYVTAHVFDIDVDAMQISVRESRDAARQVMRVFVAAGKAVEAFDMINGRHGVALFATRLAVVVSAARAAAAVLGIDVDAVVAEKAEEIFSRGWRDKPAEVFQ